MYSTIITCQEICKGVPNLVILFFERSSHLKLEHPDRPWIELKELWERSRKVKLLKSFRSTYWMKFPCIKKSILVLNNHSKGTNNNLHVQCIWNTLFYYCFINYPMYFWEDSGYESTWKRKGIRGEREKEMTKYLGKCLMFLSFLDRF